MRWAWRRSAAVGRRLYYSNGGGKSADVEVAVVGGGAVGTSLVYHLARRGVPRVVLLEKTELTAGSTWHAAGLTAFYNSVTNMKQLHFYSINLFSHLERETKQDLGFHRPGSLRLATTPARMEEFLLQQSRQDWHQAPQELVSPDRILELCPLLNIDGILGGLYHPADGHVDPYSLTMALAAGARRWGVDIRLGTAVTGLRLRDDGLWTVMTSGGELTARHVVNAAGFWAHEVARLAGVELPLVPVHHQYLVTSPLPSVQALKKEIPVLRHLEGSFYLRQERGGFLVGPYEPADKMRLCEDWAVNGVPPGFGKELFEPDVSRLEPHLQIAMELVPELKNAQIRTAVCGPIMYTPDLLPLLGPDWRTPGLWLAAGFGYGIIHSGGAGRYLADWIATGVPPVELHETDPGRFGPWTSRSYVFTKARETYGMNNSLTFPREERWAGRPTSRVTPMWERQKSRGAEHGFHAGWEQPAWFAKLGDQPGYEPSFRRGNWFGPVGRECQAVLNDVGVIDLSPFAKFLISGPQARQLLDRLVANNLPKVGTTNISHMLTPDARVYAELTITCLADDKFFVITGSGSEFHDLRWILEHRSQWELEDGVQIDNVTDQRACLGVAGPASRNLLSRLVEDKKALEDFPFLHARPLMVAGVETLALCISYTGELGWELYHNMEDSDRLYAALVESGSEDFGTYALNSLRLEKGFRMWGTEMTLDSNPYEAGLEMFLRPRKAADFVGKDALARIRRETPTRRLVQLRIDAGDSDPEGDETVWCAGKVVGHTTSGSFGYEIGCGIAFAYLPPYLAYDNCEVTVDLLGQRRPARVVTKAPVAPRHS